jgi:hypothetical protein
MQEELEKSYQQVWSYLEVGEWLDAVIAAGNLAGLDPDNREYITLAMYVREIAEIADRVKGGSRRGAGSRLEEIAHALPKLTELSSFRSLVASARYTSSKKGIVISIVVALIFVLASNLAGFQYIRAQPISSASHLVLNRDWLGIQKMDKLADIILLGDSSCLNNLAPGAVADRLGGKVINLGNNAGTSLLMDAWMLSAYIEKFGAPKAVVIARTSSSYSVGHKIEFMSDPPLPWAYWDNYGAVPNWKDGEVRQLLIQKYGVLYSDADVLRERLLNIWDLFDCSASKYLPSMNNHSYLAGAPQEKEEMDIKTHTPAYYFGKFYPNVDSTNAIQCMVSLARKYHFQLYFTLQQEWDEAVKAGLRTENLAAEKKYLSRFIDETYVHIVEQLPKTLFTKEQMQNPNHLWHGSEKIYTEEIINGIAAIQNNLTAEQARNMELTSVSLDKDSYQPGEQPAITFNVTDPGDVEATVLNGGISFLVKPSGDIDANWVARAPATVLTLNGDEIKEISLQLTAGKLEAGTYDLVVFLRQDVGGLSHETRIEIPKKIVVK